MFYSSLTLRELAVLEAANRGLAAARRRRIFDPEVFEAVAKNELNKLQESIDRCPPRSPAT